MRRLFQPKYLLRAIFVAILMASLTPSQSVAQKKPDPPSSNQEAPMAEKKGDITVSKEALEIHNSGMLFDGHNDLPWTMRRRADSSFDKVDIAQPTQFHTDIPRLKKGGLKAQFWSVYVPASTDVTGNALLQTLEQIDLVHEMVQKYPNEFEIAQTADDVTRIAKSGKVASMMGVEGGHSIQGSLSVVEKLHERGVRYMTLTHSKTLAWADSATDDAKNNGLSAFGKEVVAEMNRVGMLVDLSHVSVKTMNDSLDLTKAPVIFSHSSARAICDHPRNVPDEILKRVKKNGGVVMINFMSGYVVPTATLKDNPRARGTIYDVVDHIEHVIKIAGIDYVGIGSDYDGVSRLPVGLEDVSTYPKITQVLVDRGYNKEQIHKILGGNVLRALRAAEKVAKEIQADKKANRESQNKDSEFSVKQNGDASTSLFFGDRLIAEYMREPVDNSTEERRQETYKVYHHIYAFDGKTRLTKGAGGLFPHHRGIFFGFNRISYGDKKADVWHCNKGESQVHTGFKKTSSEPEGALTQVCLIDWNGQDDKTFAKEERSLTFVPSDKGLTVDFQSTLTSSIAEAIILDGDPQHAGVQFRASQFVPDNTKDKTFYIRPDGKGDPGKFRNWPANKEHVNLPWLAMCFEIDGKTYTCCYMDHPENPKEARFSERDYGRFGSYFKYKLTQEKPLKVKYRYWIQEGVMTVEQCEAASQAFLKSLSSSD